jgi:hypothetical protein
MGHLIVFPPRVSCSRDGGCLAQSVGSTSRYVTSQTGDWVAQAYGTQSLSSTIFSGFALANIALVKGITGRRSTQLYFATVVCLFPENLVILCHARCVRSRSKDDRNPLRPATGLLKHTVPNLYLPPYFLDLPWLWDTLSCFRLGFRVLVMEDA